MIWSIPIIITACHVMIMNALKEWTAHHVTMITANHVKATTALSLAPPPPPPRHLAMVMIVQRQQWKGVLLM